jgi:DNA-binding MarR family transcriptional regulator
MVSTETVHTDTATATDTAAVSRTEAARALVRVARLLEHACTELTLPQYRLLVMVASGDQRASKLAGRLALSKPTVTAVVDGLVERGLLARAEASGDRRAVDLSLTEAGCRALTGTDAAMAARLGWVLSHCDDPIQAESGLLQLAGAVERVVAEKMADSGK